jgi:hypothetical protein
MPACRVLKPLPATSDGTAYRSHQTPFNILFINESKLYLETFVLQLEANPLK